jgi:signal transduction histidine kinase
MGKVIKWVLALLLAMSFGRLLGAEAPPLDHVTLQLKWKHQFQFAGYYAAIAQGYYRDAGLNVSLVEADPAHDPTEEVLAGHADFGVGNSDLVVFRAKGKPVVVLAAIYQHSPLVLLVRAASGVTDLQGLYNKRLMMIPSESAEFLAYFKHEGIDPTKLDIRPHTFNIEDFISGNVDAMSAYSTDEPFHLKQRGFAFYTFIPRMGGIDFYGDCLFTTADEINLHPDRVRAFRDASLKGWDYALAHPEEIVDLILSKYNTQNKTREELLFEAQQTAELMHPGLIETGHINPGRWRSIADTYAEFGMVPRDFPLTGFIYDPNPQPDFTKLYWAIGIISVLALAALGWALPLYKLNGHLRQVIARERALQSELREAKEAAELAAAAKTHYLAVMSHEVRSPLTGLISLTEQMQGDNLSPEHQGLLAVIRRTGEDMLRLINGILEYSKIEAGHLELELAPLEIATFLDDIRMLFSASAREKGLTLELKLAPDLPVFLNTDAMRLRQILSNLLTNAIKFTESGGVTLEVSAQPEPVSGGNGPRRWHWRFSVHDTGLGIAQDQTAILFNPYAQAHSGIARRFGGTGLGLAISHQLARLLGGKLTLAETVPGQGSNFLLELSAPEVAKDA